MVKSETVKAPSKRRAVKISTADMRAWAMENYDGVGKRGPLPAHVVEDYKESQKSSR